MKRDEYREVYLRSEHWRAVRIGALERAEHRCQVCNTTKQLDVHHRTYERLGEERDADLTVLCRRCHDTFHDAKPRKATSRSEKDRQLSNSKGNAKRKAKAKRKVAAAIAAASAPIQVSPADKERYDKMRAAALDKRRQAKAEQRARKREVEQRRRDNARDRDWRDERGLPRKAA